MLRTVIAAIAVGLSLTIPAYATLAPIIVQPIILCSDGMSGGCTDANANFGLLFNQSVLNLIYAQTATTNADGTRNDDAINFSIRAPNYLDSPYTTVTVDPVNNFADTGHLLLRTANSITANEQPTVINAYLVNKIDGAAGTETYGFGLVSSNGILIEAGARLDTLAHELGHNLGLGHYVDDEDPNAAANLMAPGTSRDVPDTNYTLPAIDPAVATTIDLLDQTQVAAVHQPLFTVQGASATLGADAAFPTASVCKAGVSSCVLFIASNAADSTQALDSVTIRWTDPNEAYGVLLDPTLHGFIGGNNATDEQGCFEESLVSSLIYDSSETITGSQVTATYHAGCLLPGRASSIALSRQRDNWVYETPLSVEFDFDNGNTSLGDLDANGNFLAAPTMFGAIDTSSFAEETFTEAFPVPEPRSLALLLAGLLLLAGHSRLPETWHLSSRDDARSGP